MSALHAALQNLNAVIGQLEKSVVVLEATRLGEQRDMFAMPSNENAHAIAERAEKKQAIASRLDNAIDKVEKLLAEENAA